MSARKKDLANFDEQAKTEGRQGRQAEPRCRPVGCHTGQHSKTGTDRQETENVPDDIRPGAFAAEGLTGERGQDNRR